MKTNWMKFTKGDIVNKGFKIERIQLRITDSYFINNFVDVIMTKELQIEKGDYLLTTLKQQEMGL